VTKSVGWAGNMACMGEKRHGYWVLVEKGRDRLEEISEDKKIIFKRILKL
jgi:hypothetical protein